MQCQCMSASSVAYPSRVCELWEFLNLSQGRNHILNIGDTKSFDGGGVPFSSRCYKGPYVYIYTLIIYTHNAVTLNLGPK